MSENIRELKSPGELYADIDQGEVELLDNTYRAINALAAQGLHFFPAKCHCCDKPIFYFLKRDFPRTKSEYKKLNATGMRDELDWPVAIKSDQSLRPIREKLIEAGWKCEN